MKKYTLVFFCFVITSNVFSQKASEDSLIKIMSKEACEEMGKSEIKDINKDNLQEKLGMLLMKAFQNHLNDINTVFGEDVFTDQTQMRTIGQKIGFRLGTDCPAFMKLIMDNPSAFMDAASSNNKKKQKTTNALKEKSINILSEVTILKYVKAELSYFIIKDKKNVQHKVYWLNSFPGSELLINQTKNYINKEVTFQYSEVNFFDGSKQQYIKIKVIEDFWDGAKIEEIKEDVMINQGTN